MQNHVLVKDGGHRVKARRLVRDHKPIHQRSFRSSKFFGHAYVGGCFVFTSYLTTYYGKALCQTCVYSL